MVLIHISITTSFIPFLKLRKQLLRKTVPYVKSTDEELWKWFPRVTPLTDEGLEHPQGITGFPLAPPSQQPSQVTVLLEHGYLHYSLWLLSRSTGFQPQAVLSLLESWKR